MANEQHLEILKQGLKVWNEWREKNPKIEIDLTGADLAGEDLEGMDLTGVYLDRANHSLANLNDSKLIGAKLLKANLEDSDLNDGNLTGVDLKDAKLIGAKLLRTILTGAKLINADFTGADLTEATLDGVNLYHADLTRGNLHRANLSDSDLTGVNLTRADLSNANLSGADLSKADLSNASLIGADLSGADLTGANLYKVNLSGATLLNVNLSGASLVETNFEKANLNGCRIYGISAWDLKLGTEEENNLAIQKNLIITQDGDSTITVDSLEVAQFIYLLLTNNKIRDIIDTIGKKGVLILGRFTPERKIVLDSMRTKLHLLNYAPIIFDFEKPPDKDFTETIMILTGMCRFVIVDLTDPKSCPLELQAIIPNYMIPFVPIIQEGEKPFSMFQDLINKNRDRVLDILPYDSIDNLMLKFENAVIKPALEKHDKLMVEKNKELIFRNLKNY
jgi:uncharacterized protein YjbI with pentapeptide repeats